MRSQSVRPLLAALAVAALGLLTAAPPASAQDPSAVSCGPDPVCLALVAKNYADCDAFREGVRVGWYPVWAAEQTGVCVEADSGEVLYGFTGATDAGKFDFFALSATGAICRGTGHRSAKAAKDRSNLDGAASFACSDGRVGSAEFGAVEGAIGGAGRFLKGEGFTVSAFDMRGASPSLFAPLQDALKKAAEKARMRPGEKKISFRR
ncbi:MAG: hypothetical protein KTR21_13875 [Rhodobacteraceae bacterium]|nr:hypothetical protein [Paracoccaceae bacterium]